MEIIQKTVYVAHDGLEFFTEEECLSHELKIETVARLYHCFYEMSDLDIDWCMTLAELITDNRELFEGIISGKFKEIVNGD